MFKAAAFAALLALSATSATAGSRGEMGDVIRADIKQEIVAVEDFLAYNETYAPLPRACTADLTIGKALQGHAMARHGATMRPGTSLYETALAPHMVEYHCSELR